MKEYIVPIYDDSPDHDEIFVGYIRENATEIVRCDDCVHCADDYIDTEFGAMPCFTCDCFGGYGMEIKPVDFCSYGERRSDMG